MKNLKIEFKKVSPQSLEKIKLKLLSNLTQQGCVWMCSTKNHC
jgi:hypothetical protein